MTLFSWPRYWLPTAAGRASHMSRLISVCSQKLGVGIFSRNVAFMIITLGTWQNIMRTLFCRSNCLCESVEGRVFQELYVYGSVQRWSTLIIIQRDATQSSLFIILQVHSTCFGCQPHSSSGIHKTVTTAYGTGQLPPSNVAKLAWPRWREVAAQKIWQVPEAVVTILCTPDDGCGWHPKHVEWTFRTINRLFCVASRLAIVSIFSKRFWHSSSVYIPCPFGPSQSTQAAHRSPLYFATLTTPTDLTKGSLSHYVSE